MVVQELFARLGLDIDEVGFEKAEALVHGLHHGLMAFGAAAAGAAAVGLAGLAAVTANAAVAADRLAQSTGLDLAAVQEFGFAASTAGIDTEEMAIALRHLAKTGVTDVRGSLLQLAEQFHSMPDNGKKVEIAMEKFGRAGARMVPLLNKGKEAIGELMEEAHALGLVFSEEDVKTGEQFKMAIHEIEASFKGLGYAIGRAVLPFFTRMVQGMVRITRDIRMGVPWVQKLGVALKGIGIVIASLILAHVALTTATTTLGLASVAAALRAAAAWALAAAPVVGLAIVFAALILAVEDFYTYLQGGDSIIGKLFPEWAKQLLRIWKILTDIETVWRGLTGQMSGDDFYGKFLGLQKHGPPAPTTKPGAEEGSWMGSLMNWVGAKPSFGGGAASPAAAAATAQGSTTSSTKSVVNAPVINQTFNNAGDADPQKVRAAVKDALDEHARETGAGLE